MAKLRFGVMAPATGLNTFARTCIAHLERDALAEPVLLIVDESEERPGGLRQKLRKTIRFDGNLWHLQNKLYPLREIEAYQTTPLDTLPLPGLVCKPVLKGKWSQYFTPEDVESIRAHNLDFILKFAFGITRGAVLQAARYGVWSFHHDDEEKYRGGPPAFWEITNGDNVTGALLQRLTDRLDGGVVLKKCFVPTVGLSYRKNLQRIQASSTHMARWVCLDILNGEADYVDAAPSKTEAPIYRAPNDWNMLRFWARLLRNWFRYKIDNQRMDMWNAGLVNAPQSRFLDPGFAPSVEWTEYREDQQFIADPFPLTVRGEIRILAEELHYFTEKGRIVEIGRDSQGKLSELWPAIDEGVHMSYPYVLEHEGETYAIPESAAAKEIRLYRKDRQTGTWIKVATLIEGVDAVDATVFQHEGSWWLMHSRDSGVGPWSLYLWNAPSLCGPWTPHPGNPVKTDVQSSRPAGNPFVHEGKLYRPAQDGRRSYGGALTINRVDRLSLTAYRETVVRSIGPDPRGPYPNGIHTLSGVGAISMVDGKKHTWSARLIAQRIWAKARGAQRSKDFSYRRMRLKKD